MSLEDFDNDNCSSCIHSYELRRIMIDNLKSTSTAAANEILSSNMEKHIVTNP